VSVRYVAVNWNRQKRFYDLVIGLAVPGLVAVFFFATLLTHPGMTPETGLIRGFGLTALVLLHVILCIGPLCRLDPRFLPLLYNRRHLGVAMCLTALVHAAFAVFQYHALGNVNALVSLLTSNRAFGSLADFPFEYLGLAALIILILMAATSHDFWLSVLSPPVWKTLHMLVYVAYALLVGHVALGAMQAETGVVGPIFLALGAVTVIGLHLAAGLHERKADWAPSRTPDWVEVCRVEEIPEQRAKVVMVGGERIAVFRYEGKLACVSNVCRHQNGPLGEGKIVAGCITCPWHGYQYRPDTGVSPPPFNDKVATFNLRVFEGHVLVDPRGNPPGTFVHPVPASGSGHSQQAVETPVQFMPPRSSDAFYIGYAPHAPPPLARHTRQAVVTILSLAAGSVATLALAQPQFAATTFEYGHPRTISGRLFAHPYPMLVTDSSGGPRQYLLAGQGKHGAQAPVDGRLVSVLGTLIRRDNSAMLEVSSISLADSGTAEPPPAQTDLGNFTLTGEIVDSKCWSGVMAPGEGKTHLACAVRCLSGGLPPLLVITDEDGHQRHLILTDAAGGPMPRAILRSVGRPVTVSGRLLKEGELFFLRAAPAAIRPAVQ
jgi:methionine sulfoxide reductase heme-binding subunit